MTQQNINYGAYPNDPSADTTQVAFTKTQANFSDLYNFSGGKVSVASYGASSSASASVNTAAIQAAMTYAGTIGGIVVFQPGVVYNINTPLLQTSGTALYGPNATLKPVAVGAWIGSDYAIIKNLNFTAVSLTDHDLRVEGLRFDYSVLGNYGGTHAIRYTAAQRIRVENTYCTGSNDHSAFIGCDDTLAFACISENMNNASHDHWGTSARGPSNARVIGCHMSGAGILFNADSGSMLCSNNAQTLIATNNILLAGASIGLDTLGSNDVSNDIIISNNFISGYVIGRGAINNLVISGNVFENGIGGFPMIDVNIGAEAGGGWTGNPTNTTVTGNLFKNPNVTNSISAVILLWGNGFVSNNQVEPGTFPFALKFTGLFYGSVNVLAAGTSGTISGTLYSDQSITLPNAGGGLALADASGSFVRFNVQNDNHVILSSTDATGNVIPVFSYYARNNTPIPMFNYPIASNGGAIWLSGTGAPSGATTGSNIAGSLFSRTDGISGSRLYVSTGAGAWTAVAGV